MTGAPEEDPTRGRVVVVTGAAGGIGAAAADRLARDGAQVVVADVDGDRLAEHVEASRRAGVDLDPVRCDVSDAAAVDGLFTHVIERYGRVDVLVNNAGIAHGPESETHILATDPDHWDRLIAVNLRSLYLCSRAAAKHMVTRRSGVIVNLSSAGATRAHRNRVAYDATKGAIEAATRALALDLAPWGIRVNAVAPGAIDVERRSSIGATTRPWSDLIPLARLGTAADVAGVVRFLASGDAAYLTGIVVTVDGGLSAQLRPPALDAFPGVNPEEPA